MFDAALCVSAGRFVFTPFGRMLAGLGITKAAAWVPMAQSGDSVIAWGDYISAVLLQLPVWLLFGMVALLFFIAGYQRRA